MSSCHSTKQDGGIFVPWLSTLVLFLASSDNQNIYTILYGLLEVDQETRKLTNEYLIQSEPQDWDDPKIYPKDLETIRQIVAIRKDSGSSHCLQAQSVFGFGWKITF